MYDGETQVELDPPPTLLKVNVNDPLLGGVYVNRREVFPAPEKYVPYVTPSEHAIVVPVNENVDTYGETLNVAVTVHAVPCVNQGDTVSERH